MRYAGIGSRDLVFLGVDQTESILKKLEPIKQTLKDISAELNSGGAPGMDTVMEKFHPNDKKIIYLPYKGFNKHESDLYHISEDAITIARKFHPLGDALVEPALKFIARNGYQVLGPYLYTPVDCIICWTPNPTQGGTSQALRIAEKYKIPVFNLFVDGDEKRMYEFFEAYQNHMDSDYGHLSAAEYYESRSVNRGRTDKTCIYCGENIPKGVPHEMHHFYPEFESYATHKECSDLFINALR